MPCQLHILAPEPAKRWVCWRLDSLASVPQDVLPQRDLVPVPRDLCERVRVRHIAATVLGPAPATQLDHPHWLPGIGPSRGGRLHLAHATADEDVAADRQVGSDREPLLGGRTSERTGYDL